MFKDILYKKLMVILFLPLIFAACEKSSVTNPPIGTDVTTFPNKVGDKWVYQVQDSVNNSVDTLTVEIVGTTTGNGKNLSIWVLRSNASTDSEFVNINNNTVSFYTDSYANMVDHKIEFPLVAGNTWYNADQQFDSTIVKTQESVTVPVNTFADAYRLDRKWGSFNVYGFSQTWFVDNIGVVKFYRRIQGFDNIKETWVLISYNIQ